MTSERRYHGFRAIAGPAGFIARPLLRRHGLARHDLVARWTDAVGPELARHTAPHRYIPDRQGGGTLQLRVAGAWALEVQHLAPIIIERINAVFGYRAVTRLAIRQGPLPARQNADKPARTAAPGPRPTLSEVRHADLRAALEALGARVAAGRDSDKKS